MHRGHPSTSNYTVYPLIFNVAARRFVPEPMSFCAVSSAQLVDESYLGVAVG
ncbi:hypothetical protein [Rhodococcoides navarretei]|uniref:Uncharacterized protein n=1 Tax=Rhodococcus navarretei TaxID=3128981 RepID=A0ABU9CW01_9NOCA